MPTHPLWRPFETVTPEELAEARARIGVWRPEPVEVVAPDPAWPAAYEEVCRQLRAALGERAVTLEHVGSTAVPGLWAKPMIDVDLVLADPADERAWLPDLEAAGFVLRVREPDFEEHRVMRGSSPPANVHVWRPGGREVRRHVLFRDWLRTHDADRERYGSLKREVAGRGFDDVMLYNNEKAWLVYDIYEQIFAADSEHPHDPRPRD